MMTTRRRVVLRAFGAFVFLAMSGLRASAQNVKVALDPGVRSGAPSAGGALRGLTADEIAFFRDGLARFADIEVVTGGGALRVFHYWFAAAP